MVNRPSRRLVDSSMPVIGVPIGYSSPKTFLDTSTGVAAGSSGDATVLQPTGVCVVPSILNAVNKGIRAKVSSFPCTLLIFCLPDAKVAAKGQLASDLIEWAFQYRLKWTRRGHDTPIMNRCRNCRTLIMGNRT